MQIGLLLENQVFKAKINNDKQEKRKVGYES